MECRPGCGACCIAPSISSAIPGMPDGKPSGVRCTQLTPDNLCRIFGMPERPRVCSSLAPGEEMCGTHEAEALERLSGWELMTRPDSVVPGKTSPQTDCTLEPELSSMVSPAP